MIIKNSESFRRMSESLTFYEMMIRCGGFSRNLKQCRGFRVKA